MIEVVLFDADGVVIAKRQKYFSQRLMDDFGVSQEDSIAFVKNLLQPAMTGKTDLKAELPPYLQKWGVSKSVDELLEYWWSGEKTLNKHVLEVVDHVKESGIPVYLAADQEKYRGLYLMNDLGLNQHFNGAFMSYDLGFQKHDPEFWEKVLEQLKVQNPSNILYWDDDQKNVDIAQTQGLTAKYYQDSDQFKDEMIKLGVLNV